MKKSIIIAAILAVIGMAAQAGFDQYNSKNYTTCLTPSVINAANVTNSATTGTDIIGLPGNGCLVFSYSCVNDAAAILKFQVATCATTNGSYAVYTNSDSVASWSFTNSAGHAKMLFKPNSVSRYLRVYVTPTVVTNGFAGALLVTE